MDLDVAGCAKDLATNFIWPDFFFYSFVYRFLMKLSKVVQCQEDSVLAKMFVYIAIYPLSIPSWLPSCATMTSSDEL